MTDLIQGKNIKAQAWIKFNYSNDILNLNHKSHSSLDDKIQQHSQNHQKVQRNSNYISSLYENPINSPNKLIMHSFVKFKSFSFNFSRIFKPKNKIIQMSQQLSNSIYQNLYVKNLPSFCGIGIGGYQSGINQIIQGNSSSQGLFYSSIINLIEKIKKNIQKDKSSDQIIFHMNFVSVLQNNVVDLLNLNKKVILANDVSSNQKFDYYILKPLVFEGATNYEFITAYDFYTTLKKVFHIKKQIKDWGIFALQMLISQPESCDQLKNILLVQWQKSPKNQLIYSKMFQSEKPLLCLNQSILELYKFKEKRKSQTIQQNQKEVVYKKTEINQLKNIQSFRNSAITRILKPFLLFDSKIVVIGSCSLDQNLENDSYQTLMFCKHISKIASFAKFRPIKNRELHIESIQKPIIQSFSTAIKLNNQQKNQKKNELKHLNHSNQAIIKIQSPLFQQKKQQSSRINQKYGSKLAKKYQQRSKTPSFSEVKDPILIKQKMQKMLTQINEKSLSSVQQEMAQMLKNEYQLKKQLLLVKKQRSVIQAKQRNARLKTIVNSSLPYINKKFKNKKQQQEIQRLEIGQLKRLAQKQSHIQNQIENIAKIISNKLCQISSKNDQTQIKSNYLRNKQAMQNIKILRNQLKMELQLIQQETNIFLEEKQKIKKVYQTQLINIRQQQNQLMKKIVRKTEPILEIQQERRKDYFSLQISRKKNSKHKHRPLRLIKDMEPYFSSEKHNSGRKYIKNRKQFNTIEYDTPKPKKLRQLQESIQNQEDGRNIKLSRSLIKRKQALKQKIRKGRVQVNSFLDQVVDKYNKYGQQRIQKVKSSQQNN